MALTEHMATTQVQMTTIHRDNVDTSSNPAASVGLAPEVAGGSHTRLPGRLSQVTSSAVPCLSSSLHTAPAVDVISWISHVEQ